MGGKVTKNIYLAPNLIILVWICYELNITTNYRFSVYFYAFFINKKQPFS